MAEFITREGCQPCLRVSRKLMKMNSRALRSKEIQIVRDTPVSSLERSSFATFLIYVTKWHISRVEASWCISGSLPLLASPSMKPCIFCAIPVWRAVVLNKNSYCNLRTFGSHVDKRFNATPLLAKLSGNPRISYHEQELRTSFQHGVAVLFSLTRNKPRQ